MQDMDESQFSEELAKAVGAPLPDQPSPGRGGIGKEWIPPLAAAILAVVYFLARPGSNTSQFAFYVGLGFVPGLLWSLLGHRSWNVHRIGFAAGLIAFVVTNPGLRPDADSWRRIVANWHLVALGFLVSFTQPLWGMFRTHRLLVDGGIVITLLNSLKLCLTGSFFNIFLPGSTGGDAYRVYAVTDGYKRRLAPAIAAITLDRLLGLPSLILVVVVGLMADADFFMGNRTLSKLVPVLAVTAAVCLLLVVYLVFAAKSGRRIAGMTSEPPPEPLARPPGRLKRAHLRISATVKRPGTLPLSLVYGFMSHLACIAACQLFGMALGVEGVPMRRYYLIVPLAMTINAIPGAPGGLGQGELAMATLLRLASPAPDNAQAGVMIMLLFRLSNMAMGVLGGIFYALGKTELSGVSQETQGVTRLLAPRRSTRLESLRRRARNVTRFLHRPGGDGDGAA